MKSTDILLVQVKNKHMIEKIIRELSAKPKVLLSLVSILILTVIAVVWAPGAEAQSTQNPQSGAIGIEGVIPIDPPETGAIISFPINGQTFTNVPIDVTGICPANLLVNIFKNEVFAGSVQCSANGSFSVTVDLFSGSNDLVARVFDDLDQPGPDSNTVTVFHDDGSDISNAVDRVILTSNFAKRGANPGSRLIWPFTISGGVGPYAVVVDWGDGEDSILSLSGPGEFDAEHIYERPGTYRVIVKATDSNGTTTFFQVVGVANGALTSDSNDDGVEAVQTRVVSRFVIWPMYILLLLIVSTFWLGKRYEKRRIKKLMEKNLA